LSEAAKSVLQDAPQRQAMDSVYAIAQAPADAQPGLARRVTEDALSRRETQALAAAVRQASPESLPRHGRPRTTRSHERTPRATKRASVPVTFRKPDVTQAESIAALEDVLLTLRAPVAAA